MVKLSLSMVIGTVLDLKQSKLILNFIIKGFLYCLFLINNLLLSQIALPTFHDAQKAHTSASSGSQTFSYTGAQQTFTVPSGVTSITIEMWGAQGGSVGYYSNSSYCSTGGKGCCSTGNLSVTSGSSVYVYIGGQGDGFATCNTKMQSLPQNSGGWNGGGNSYGGTYPGTSGGGGSGYIGGVSSGSTITGNASIPNPDGGTKTGREGNGLAIISW